MTETTRLLQKHLQNRLACSGQSGMAVVHVIFCRIVLRDFGEWDSALWVIRKCLKVKLVHYLPN